MPTQREGQPDPAGRLSGRIAADVSIGQNGRVVGNYSNGRNIDLAQISVATFNGTNFLKRIDGGAFEATDQSGQALFGSGGTIAGSSLESSNTETSPTIHQADRHPAGLFGQHEGESPHPTPWFRIC